MRAGAKSLPLFFIKKHCNKKQPPYFVQLTLFYRNIPYG